MLEMSSVPSGADLAVMSERTLDEVLVRMGETTGCGCQVWTGLSTCSCDDSDDPEVLPVQARQPDSHEALARALYEKTLNKKAYWETRARCVPWDDLSDAARVRLCRDARNFLACNGKL